MRTLFLIFPILLLFACSKSQQAKSVTFQPAQNIEVHDGYLAANFPDGSVAVYFDGSASVLSNKRPPQMDFDGATFPDLQGVWICSNSETGDYLKLDAKTGVATAKIEGVMYHFLPSESKPLKTL